MPYFAKYWDLELVQKSCPVLPEPHNKTVFQDQDTLLDVERQEGAMMGMISTLTGAAREATIRARGTVWTCIFNEAELEQLVTCNSSVAVRM
ncbi:MAG: hypothetical protein AAGD05_13725, partial [Bacteroidota bacterium]